MSQFSVTDEMAARYIVNRQKELEQIKASFEKKDYAYIASRAHNIKGTAPSFGFPELGDVGEILETAALDSDEGQVQEQILQIERWLQQRLK